MSDQNSESASLKTATLPRQVQVSTCGKAIIVGEHAVVYGAHAVAMPLKQLRMEIQLKPISHSESTAPEYHLKLGGKEVSKRVTDVIPEAFELLQQPTHSIQAKGQSHLPIGAGLGSSASLCIAIVKAIASSLQLNLTEQDLAQLGNQLEARFHGNPSGLDTSVVAYEQCIYFAKPQTVEPIKLPSAQGRDSWQFALIDSRIRASTMAMIRIAEPFFRGVQGERHLQIFDEIATSVRDGLTRYDFAQVSEAMMASHQLLTQAGVVPDSLQSMIDECLRLGVFAAKITGAGGGGTILCLLNPDDADTQFAKLRQHFTDNHVYRVSI